MVGTEGMSGDKMGELEGRTIVGSRQPRGRGVIQNTY
jgi:hypothetical protein